MLPQNPRGLFCIIDTPMKLRLTQKPELQERENYGDHCRKRQPEIEQAVACCIFALGHIRVVRHTLYYE